MKLKNTILPLLAALTLGSHAATIRYEIGTLDDEAQDVSTLISAGDFTGNTAVYNLSSTVGAEAFTFTLTVSPGAGVAEIASLGGGFGDSAFASGNLQDGDVISFDISAISNANVQFDGYFSFGYNLNSGLTGDGFTIDGVDYVFGTAVNGDSDPRQGINFPGTAPNDVFASNSVDVTIIDNGDDDGIVIRGVSLQFSEVVPEPSSSALLGLAGLALVSRRKRS